MCPKSSRSFKPSQSRMSLYALEDTSVLDPTYQETFRPLPEEMIFFFYCRKYIVTALIQISKMKIKSSDFHGHQMSVFYSSWFLCVCVCVPTLTMPSVNVLLCF